MICKKCGGKMTIDRSVVYTTYPPKYKAVCENCGEIEYPFCSACGEGILDHIIEIV